MKNYEKILYTYKHRKVVLFLAKYYFNDNELLKKIGNHDIDKMFLLLFYEKKDIEKLHRNLSSHHDNDLEKNELDYIEMVLDWESARYTKEDKPLNAYDTLYKFYPHLEDKILSILKRIGLDYSTFEKDKSVVDYVKTLDNTSITDIKNELINYINDSISSNDNIKKKIK